MASSGAMSLATRCTSCGTIFKVVQDQLKVSEGWVRCGRCNAVFNALEGLFDLERDPPPQRPAHAPRPEDTAPRAPAATIAAPTSAAAPAASAADRSNAPTQPTPLNERATTPEEPHEPATHVSPDDFEDVPATHEDDALDSRWLLRSSSDGISASAHRSRQAQRSDFADARFPQDAELDIDDDAAFLIAPDATAPPSHALRPMPEIKNKGDGKSSGKRSKDTQKRTDKRTADATRQRTGKKAEEPSFIKRANRQAQWRHPLVRTTLGGVALALMALLGVQLGIAFREPLAARYPAIHPLLAQLCDTAGCHIGPWRHIDDLTVDSVTLVRTGRQATTSATPGSTATETTYTLSVAIHNRAEAPVATPHVEIRFTDTTGALISQRVLSPTEFSLSENATLPPASDTTLHTRLSSSSPLIAGYTVDLFYP